MYTTVIVEIQNETHCSTARCSHVTNGILKPSVEFTSASPQSLLFSDVQDESDSLLNPVSVPSCSPEVEVVNNSQAPESLVVSPLVSATPPTISKFPESGEADKRNTDISPR